jgi:hypothetical protein
VVARQEQQGYHCGKDVISSQAKILVNLLETLLRNKKKSLSEGWGGRSLEMIVLDRPS